MRDRTAPGRVNPSVFFSHILWEKKDRSRLTISVLKRDEEAIESLMDAEWNYALEYDKACREAKEKWYPYGATEILRTTFKWIATNQVKSKLF